MTLTLQKIYEDTTKQAWSIFDSDISSLEDDDAGVINSIQKALSELWLAYPYSFRLKNYETSTEKGEQQYRKPNGDIDKIYITNTDSKKQELKCIKPQIDDETGLPTGYYIRFNKINLYPIPDNEYELNIEYFTNKPAKNVSGDDIYNLYELTDYINIQEEYEDIFKNALITKAMVMSIASPQNRNYSSYQEQALKAFKTLINSTNTGVDNKSIIW